MSSVPDVTVEGRITGGDVVELDDFSQTPDGDVSKPGLCESQVSVEVGVAKTTQAPEPLKANSLLRGTGVTPQATDHDAPVGSSSDRLQTNGCSDSDYGSAKSSPGYVCTSFGPDLCDGELSEFDGSSIENTDANPPVSSQSNKNSELNPVDDGGDSKTDLTVKRAEDSLCGSSPASPDASPSVRQTRDSFDVRWDEEEEDRDEDRRSTRSRRSVKEGMCCCYQALHRAFLQCVEETPAMLSGLLLSLAFCVAIIVLIPTTERVRRGESVCLCYFITCHVSA